MTCSVFLELSLSFSEEESFLMHITYLPAYPYYEKGNVQTSACPVEFGSQQNIQQIVEAAVASASPSIVSLRNAKLVRARIKTTLSTLKQHQAKLEKNIKKLAKLSETQSGRAYNKTLDQIAREYDIPTRRLLAEANTTLAGAHLSEVQQGQTTKFNVCQTALSIQKTEIDLCIPTLEVLIAVLDDYSQQKDAATYQASYEQLASGLSQGSTFHSNILPNGLTTGFEHLGIHL